MRRLLILLSAVTTIASAVEPAPQRGGELRFVLRADPKTFDPLQAADEASETVRHLTGGVLVRLNRYTQQLQPELARSWKVSEGNRRLDFELRPGVLFSDGSPFSCQDVEFTLRRIMDPALHSPLGDSFRTGKGPFEVECTAATTGMARFPAAVAELALLFDQVAILSSRLGAKEATAAGPFLGPFVVAERKAGVSVALTRNPNYWKRDSAGTQLPYLSSIRLEVQQNRETEVLRFRRGEIDLVNKLDPELFDRISAEMPKAALDAGPSLDWEFVFFNQVPNAPIDEYKKVWFQSQAFRRAISEAINRDDIRRVVYRGHATVAASIVSPTNRFWNNKSIPPTVYSAQSALRRLEKEGFRKTADGLVDPAGHRVEFSMISNAGSKVHARMLAMMQDDLAKIGVKLNVTTLDFPSFAERIMQSFKYETCLAAMTNIGLDPNEVMNIWMSSGANHPWYPSQKTPATPWEAEIDHLLIESQRFSEPAKRKTSFDRVQQIIADQAPVVFLVFPNALSAVSARVRGITLAPLNPTVYWNAEHLSVVNAR